jgi:hypothetical protein
MRLLTVGFSLPHPSIDNYNALTAPSYFDYEAVLIDPLGITRTIARLLEEGESFEAFDGRPVINAPTSASAVSAADMLRRRLDETQRLLESGGTVVVFARPNAVHTGIAGFEGCDRYSWLPAPAGMAWGPPYLKAAEGSTLRVVAEGHPITAFLRKFRSDALYRAVFDERQAPVRNSGRVIVTGGADVPTGMEFDVAGGRVLFIPAVKDDPFANRAEMGENLFEAISQVMDLGTPVETPGWARSIAVPGLEQVEAQLEEAEQAQMDASAQVRLVRDRHTALAAHRRLLTEEGKPLARAVQEALGVLGFGVLVDAAVGLTVESEGLTAFVESEGSRDEVVEWPYVRLQRRQESRMLQIGDNVRGLVVVNGRRAQAPDERAEPRFTDALRIACENYRYSLVTTETLFEMVKRALGGADEAELTGMRRRLLAAQGLLPLAHALGEVAEGQDTGPIF